MTDSAINTSLSRSASGCPNDLRSFIALLEQAGELRRVTTEVDWRYEVGAMSRLVTERRGPAPLFERVKDYPDQRIAAVLFGPTKPNLHGRIALSLGLSKETPALDLIEQIRQRLKVHYPPTIIKREAAACKEIVVAKEDINLEQLAVPWIKEIDGGRYLGTGDIVVCKDPDSGWINWGTYRCMITGPQEFSILLMPVAQHGGEIFAKYQAAKKPMPLALVIGADPASQLVAGSPVHHGVSEVDISGGLRGEGVPVVKCETNDLLVPANAEMIIEAAIWPGELVEEGPFGEYTGHATQHGKVPLARVTFLTHRRNPIHLLANMGKPWDDSAVPSSLMTSAIAKNRLEDNGIRVKAIYHYVPGTAAIAVKPQPGIHQRIVSILLSAHRLAQSIVFVDEDVDVTNIEDVWWAICTRMNPESYEVVHGVGANLLMPWLTPEQRERHEVGLWVMDASFPYAWTPDYRASHTVVSDFTSGFSDEIKTSVLSRWQQYGYGDVT